MFRFILLIENNVGRLWAALIQLCYDDGELYQSNVLRRALQAVPKSGEVWCEGEDAVFITIIKNSLSLTTLIYLWVTGARIFLNPFSPTFDLQTASRHLYFAVRFTPQFGDSFLEHLRLNMIDQWIVPLAIPFINTMHVAFLSRNKMNIQEAYKLVADHTKNAADVMKNTPREASPRAKNVLDTSDLELRCSSADPNYGHLWFLCRSSPIDTAREVISQAKIVLADSIFDYSYLYIAAIVRRAGLIMVVQHQAEQRTVPDDNQSIVSAHELPHPNSHEWEKSVDIHARSAPSLNDMISITGVDSNLFTSGWVGDYHNWDKLSLAERRKILFGTDSLLN